MAIRRVRLGFSLIELLVVVAIIALMVSILLPSLTRARQQAQRVACGSNQKQVIAGIYMYAQDQGGYVPYGMPRFNLSLTWCVYQEWGGNLPKSDGYPAKGFVHHGLLFGTKQIRDPQTFFCPAYFEFPHVYPKGWNEFTGFNGKERRATSFIYALSGQIDKYPKGQRTFVRLDRFKPREALFADVFMGNPSRRQKVRVWPHRGGINAAKADGSMILARVDPRLANTGRAVLCQ